MSKTNRSSRASHLGSREIADASVKAVATKMRLPLDDLHFDTVRKSILGSHVLYQQYCNGVPISGAWLRIDVSPEGRVFHILNDLVPGAVVKRSSDEVSIGAREADRRARAAIGVAKPRVMKHELVHYDVDGTPQPCWKVIVRSARPAGSWKVYIDARDGGVVGQFDLTRKVAGQGRVFDPNPVSALDDPALRPDAPLPPQAYRDVELKGLDGSGFLDGEFASTRRTGNRTSSATNHFIFASGDRAFREVMAYYHIDCVRRYLAELGFGDVLNRAVEVNIDSTTDDLSQYDPPTKSILFGSGGVPDAEDGEIIVHEYGHAIQDDQVPGFGESGEARAMGEGFGDFLSASFFADRKSPAMQPMIGTWDATGYPVPAAFLRRVDGTKKYPKDVRNNVYADGEIWSGCLWEMRKQLGRKTAETLAIAHHHLLARDATFRAAAEAIVLSDKQLNGGANAAAIRKIFTDRGILPRPKKRRLTRKSAARPHAGQSSPNA